MPNLVTSGKHKVFSEPWLLRENIPNSEGRAARISTSDKQFSELFSLYSKLLESSHCGGFNWKVLLQDLFDGYVFFGRSNASRANNKQFVSTLEFLANVNQTNQLQRNINKVLNTIVEFGPAIQKWMQKACDPVEMLYGVDWREDMKLKL